MSIVPLLANASFDPETLETLSAAFDDAWEKLRQSGSSCARPPYRRGTREILAKRIIELAQKGERDQNVLSNAAVAYLAAHHAG